MYKSRNSNDPVTNKQFKRIANTMPYRDALKQIENENQESIEDTKYKYP